MSEQQQQTFTTWAIVELFGHQQTAGLVSEHTIASTGFIRVDVPESPVRPGFTRFFSPSAIYSIVPTSEEIARAFADRNVSRPVQAYQLAHPVLVSGDEEYDATGDNDEETAPF